MKIIVVDNEPDRLEELVKCLRAAFPNAEITDFTSPSLAVQYSFENPVDLVFAEYYTRRFNGIQVAEGIHHFRHLIPDPGGISYEINTDKIYHISFKLCLCLFCRDWRSRHHQRKTGGR